MNVAVDHKTTDTSIIAVVRATPELVLKDEAKFGELLVAMKAQIAEFVPDVSTKAGREEIASFAFKFARTKTAIDAAGKKLNEDDQKAIKARNEVRNRIVDTLQDLQNQVRKPLDIWEAAEDKRLDFVKSELADLRGTPNYPQGWGAAEVAEQIAKLKARTFDVEVFHDQTDQAVYLRDAAVIALDAAHIRLVKADQDRAELERLRAEKEQRDRAEAERLAKEEADRRRVAAAEVAERKRVADAAAEEERIAAATKRAEETARAELDRKHQDEIDRMRAEQAKRDREEAARAAEAKRVADEEAARAANQVHRTKIKAAAKAALMTCGADEETAKKIVVAIIAGEIPAVTLRF